jgi:hypothetical protein
MKHVVLALAVAVIGVGLVFVGSAQAHGGIGYGSGDETETSPALTCVPHLSGNLGILPCETVRDGGYKF